MLWVLPAVFALLTDNPTIDKALDLAERGQYEEADKLIQPLLDQQDPLASWARWQIQLIRTRTLPAGPKKIEGFEELIRRFQSLSGVPEYAKESLAQALEAQARTYNALGDIAQAVNCLEQSEAKYAELMKKPLPESQLVRVYHGYIYVVTLSSALRPPPLARFRDRVREIDAMAEGLMVAYSKYPQSIDGALYASDIFRQLALKIDSEMRAIEIFEQRAALLAECRGAWARSRSWARDIQRSLVTANGTAKELRTRAIEKELDAVLGQAEWLHAQKEPIQALLTEAAALLKDLPPRLQIRAARLAILRGDEDEAMEILAGIKDPPLKPQAIRIMIGLRTQKPRHAALIAEQLHADGRYLEAIPFFQKAGRAYTYQIGECYYLLERLVEAAAAFSEYRQADLRSSEEAKDASVTEYQILLKLQQIDPQPARKDQIQEIRDYLAQRGWLGTLDQRNRAIELEQAEKFDEAADQWKAIASTPDSYLRQEALSRAGSCLFKAGSTKEAAELFERHLKESRTQPGHARDLIVTVYSLAQIRDPKTAAASIEQFVRENASLELGVRLGLAVHALNAYVRAGDLRSAQGVLDYVRENRADRQEEYARALGLLAWGYDAQSEDVGVKNPKLSEDYFNNAVQLYTQSLTAVAQPVLKFEAALSIAGRTFERAKVKEDAALFSRSRTLFEHIKTRYPDQIRKDLGIQIDWHIGQCYLNEKNFDSALEHLKRVSDMSEPNLYIDEALGDCWFGKGLQAEGKERVDYLNRADKAFNDIVNAYARARQREEVYYRNLWKRLEVLYHIDRVELRQTIELYRQHGIGKGWDDNRWGYKTRILEVEKRLAEKDPSFRILPE